MLSKKVPFYFLVFSMLIGAVLVFVIFISFTKSSHQKKLTQPTSILEQSTSCDYNIVRLSGYRYVKPLLFTDQNCETTTLAPLKTDINNLVNSLKSSDAITSVSIYLRLKGGWLSINPDEKFNPGSLLKVPVLLTFLRIAEANPALLNKQIVFNGHDNKLPKQTIVSETLKPGHSYTMRELMKYMIIYSDNDATELLETQINNKEFQKTFTDMGLSEELMDENGAYKITAKDYSTFLRVLYNGSYLSPNNSEYAATLLAESAYKGALSKGLPDKTEMMHKFGEAGNTKEHQLHDAGIIYINDTPYLLTIMTKGHDLNKMSDAIGQLSKLIYNHVASNKI